MTDTLIFDASMEVLGVRPARKAVGYILSGKGYSLLDSDRLVSPTSDIKVPLIVCLKEAHAYKSRKSKKPLNWSRKRVLQRDNYVCAYCSGYANTIDHIHPQALGGGNTWMNTIAACFKCNNEKDDKTLDQVGMKLLYLPTVPTHFKVKVYSSLSPVQKAFLADNGLDALVR